mgnify:CR=1 FL=1
MDPNIEKILKLPKSQKIALDFNPTYFAHAKAADGFTLSSADEGVRKFWVKHGIASRKIAAAMGKATDIRTVGAALYFLPVQTRVALKFGAETLTQVTCARAWASVQ